MDGLDEARQVKQRAASLALAEARRCPACRRKSALTLRRDAAGVLHRTCRWPDCRHDDTPEERPPALEHLATVATRLAGELARQGRSGRATWAAFKDAVAALGTAREG